MTKKATVKVGRQSAQSRAARSFAEELLEIRRQKKPVLPVKAHVAHFGDAALHALLPHP